MKKILYIQNLRIPNNRAHGIFIVKSCEALGKLGQQTKLIIPKLKMVRKVQKKDIFSYYGLKQVFSLIKLPVIELPLFKTFPATLVNHFYYQIRTWSFYLRAYRLSLREKPDFIFTTDREIFLLFFFFQFIKRPKLIYDCHIGPINMYGEITDFFVRRRADLIVVTVSFLKKYYLKKSFPEAKIVISPNGVNLDDYQIEKSSSQLKKEFRLPLKKIIIGYVGRFETMGEEKGLFTLLDAVRILDKKGYKVAFVAAGGPVSLKKQYEKYAAQIGLNKSQYYILPQIPTYMVPKLLKTFSICVLPYPKTPHFYHIMSPMKLIEYMACERPIVASDMPSVREILTSKGAFFCKPNNALSLAKAIENAITDRSQVKRKVNFLKKKVKQLTWESRVQKIITALQ